MLVSIHNHLGVPIKIFIKLIKGKPFEVASIKPKDKGVIKKDLLYRSVMTIYLSNGVVYNSITLDEKERELGDDIYIGMVTYRTILSSDSKSTTLIGLSEGTSHVNIHNLTSIPLRINEVTIPPHKTIKYTGEIRRGVLFGTVFQNKDGLYPQVEYLSPSTDLYYGLISDTLQPNDGGWQMEFYDKTQPDQVLWPLH